MMKPTRYGTLSGLFAVTALLVSSQTLAQQASSPTSRAEVKAETRQAEKEHRLVPAGEGTLSPAAPPTRSTKTRQQRKAETIAARDAGEIIPAGEGAGMRPGRRAAGATRSTKSRAEVKSETRRAAKAHELVPAGEGSVTAPQK